MSLSANRSRRSNAGNRWAEALAAAQLENGDAPDPDAEGSGEEFVGKEEEDVFASDFESTDEEEYAKQGVEDGEKQVLMAERAERRAARNKASKSVAAPVQRILDRAMRGEPMPKRRKVEPKKVGEPGPKAKRGAGIVGWDATRQSERALTVKHKALVQERLKDAAKKKAYAPRRPRQVAPPKTQDELIAAALELEEKNTKSLKEFLVKEEEKRAAARRVVRMKIDGPKLRWVSRGEQVRIKLVDEGATEGSGSATKSPGSIAATAQDGLPPQNQLAPSTSDIPSQPVTPSQPSGASEPSMQNQLPSSSTTQPPGSGGLDTRQALPTIAETSHTPTPSRRSSTPARQRMQVYVELPRPKHHSSPASGSTGRASSLAPSSQKLAVPSSQPLTRSPLSTSHPLPRSPLSTSQPLLPSSSQPTSTLPPPMSRSASAPEHTTARQTTSPVNALQPPNLDALRRPNAIRQGSVSSSSSSKSKMIMYVELPAPRKKSNTPVPRDTSNNVATGPDGNCELNANTDSKEPNIPAVVAESVVTSESLVKAALPSRSKDSDLFPPGGPNFAIVLPTRKPTHKTERYMRNYVIADLGERRPPFEKSMQTIFGDHANWQDAIINGVKPRTQAKPICAITGLAAPYRDPRTGIPYANAYAYKTLTRLLAHEFVWSKEKGCYVGDEGQNPARGVPSNWASAAAGRF